MYSVSGSDDVLTLRIFSSFLRVSFLMSAMPLLNRDSSSLQDLKYRFAASGKNKEGNKQWCVLLV